MKKFFKKVILIFFTLSIVLSVKVNANMSIEAMEESQEFYEKHEILIITTGYINNILQILLIILISSIFYLYFRLIMNIFFLMMNYFQLIH